MYQKADFIAEQIAERIRAHRITRKWTQETLAALTGLHRNHIGRVERADYRIKFETVYRIAEVFDLTLAEFLKDMPKYEGDL